MSLYRKLLRAFYHLAVGCEVMERGTPNAQRDVRVRSSPETSYTAFSKGKTRLQTCADRPSRELSRNARTDDFAKYDFISPCTVAFGLERGSGRQQRRRSLQRCHRGQNQGHPFSMTRPPCFELRLFVKNAARNLGPLFGPLFGSRRGSKDCLWNRGGRNFEVHFSVPFLGPRTWSR